MINRKHQSRPTFSFRVSPRAQNLPSVSSALWIALAARTTQRLIAVRMERHARVFAGVEQCAEQQTAAAASRQPQVVLRELPSPKRPLSFHLGADSALLHSEANWSAG